MEPEIVERLICVNKEFYRQFAEPFSETRGSPQPGFFLLLEYLPDRCKDILDIGCGDARFIKFLKNNGVVGRYTGVDFSSHMLNLARTSADGVYYEVDLSKPDCLDRLGFFDLISCLATLQHIPGYQNRTRLLREISQHIRIGGRIFLSNWQFLDSPRQKKKITDWSEIGIKETDLEDNDYLVTWNRGGFGRRYVAYIDMDETRAMAENAGLRIIDAFRNDGQEGNLNLYTVLTLPR